MDVWGARESFPDFLLGQDSCWSICVGKSAFVCAFMRAGVHARQRSLTMHALWRAWSLSRKALVRQPADSTHEHDLIGRARGLIEWHHSRLRINARGSCVAVACRCAR